MAKRGPKPKEQKPRPGRKIGTKFFQTKDWNINDSIGASEDGRLDRTYDNSRFYEIAKAYVVEYGIKPLHAARLAVEIEYANLMHTRRVFWPLNITDPAGKRERPTQEEFEAKTEDLTANVMVTTYKIKRGFKPELHANRVDIANGLPEPAKSWIDGNDPTAQRVAKRISREIQIKTKR